MKKFEELILPAVVNYIDKDPVRNTKKIIDKINALGLFKMQKKKVNVIFDKLEKPGNPWHDAIMNIKNNLNKNARKKLLSNFLFRASLIHKKTREKYRKDSQIPFAILMDPTSACNLECIGCWAKDYNKTDSMSFDTLDSIIKQGKEIGTFVYIYSGGEPLVRKKDIIKLCDKHPDCYFLAFTNGTLIDEKFASEVARVGNFAPAISIEGFEKETDFRRGKGTYTKAIEGMRLMRKHGNLFGFSTAYHRLNTEVVGGDEFINAMKDEGCYFGWYFTYMPVGSDAQSSLIVTPEQRAYMYHRIREIRQSNPMFLMDFWNDGEFVGGCIAGGRHYLHINARGDVEPCAFIHYSSVNIHDVSLREALKQPLFEQYRKHQPFNHNHLRPCPCLDNPDKLRKMVHTSQAKSTQLNDEESVEQLTAKCEEHAEGWALLAEDLKNGNGSCKCHTAAKIEVDAVIEE